MSTNLLSAQPGQDSGADVLAGRAEAQFDAVLDLNHLAGDVNFTAIPVFSR
jgi:hypothetical protein